MRKSKRGVAKGAMMEGRGEVGEWHPLQQPGIELSGIAIFALSDFEVDVSLPQDLGHVWPKQMSS